MRYTQTGQYLCTQFYQCKFCPFKEGDKILLTKVTKDIFGGPSTVLTRKAAVDETHTHKSTIVCHRLLRKMSANFTLAQCGNLCLLHPTQHKV